MLLNQGMLLNQDMRHKQATHSLKVSLCISPNRRTPSSLDTLVLATPPQRSLQAMQSAEDAERTFRGARE